MTSVIADMLKEARPRSLDEHVRTLREILQQVALLGLWRGGFFKRSAFYGGTALRLLHGSDRFSEDLDFSLLVPDASFDLTGQVERLREELIAFGFDLRVEVRGPVAESAIRSAFLKGGTREQMLVLSAGEELVRMIPQGQVLKIKLEVDTDPPPGFETELRYLFRPVPFAVRVYALPCLLAGKVHAVLCRGWKGRVKGRDWYDLAWYAGHAPQMGLSHLESRMRQSGHWTEDRPLDEAAWRGLMEARIAALDVGQARDEVARFVADPRSLELWSHDYFRAAVQKLVVLRAKTEIHSTGSTVAAQANSGA
jgi:hypothetical protein